MTGPTPLEALRDHAAELLHTPGQEGRGAVLLGLVGLQARETARLRATLDRVEARVWVTNILGDVICEFCGAPRFDTDQYEAGCFCEALAGTGTPDADPEEGR